MYTDPDLLPSFLGNAIRLSDPDSCCVEIYDIAVSLSHQARFAGHTAVPYSVAQHSVLVSYLVSDEYALEALLHDASEAYLQDLTRPLRRGILHDSKYAKAERAWAKRIGRAFGLEDKLANPPQEVVQADNVMLITECRDLVNHPKGVKLMDFDVEPSVCRIVPWTAKESQREFLARFCELRARRF